MEESESRSFEAINVILPFEVGKETEGVSLEGYAKLKEMRDRTAEFRAGYKNWRMKGAKGARGETSDVFQGRAIVSNIAPLPEIPERKSLLESVEAIPVRRPSVTGQSINAEEGEIVPCPKDFEELAQIEKEQDPLLQEQKKQPLIKGDPNVLQSEINPESWLRFYYNPLTPLDMPFQRNYRIQNSILPSIGPPIRTPTYHRDPKLVQNWILHIGVGGFHRSHQAVYLDDILEKFHGQNAIEAVDPKTNGVQKKTLSWGLCGVGLLPFDVKMRDALRSQDYLYTVLTRSTSKSEARIIGSILDFMLVPECTTEEIEARLLDEKLKIISLTITEKGYCQRTDGKLDIEHPMLKQDIESKLEKPNTAIGFILKGILLRYTHKMAPFTIQSCDNMPENGHIARRMVIQLAEEFLSQGSIPELDEDFITFLKETIKFPSAMVDRITPVTQPQHREILLRDFGLDDEWPVIAEEFSQWVLEDEFVSRPPWEIVGALMVHDVGAYEALKLRLLNGGHSAMCYVSVLAGFNFVDDALGDVRVSQFLRAYMDEMTPSVMTTVQIEVERYKDKIVERFSNRMIKDALSRICEDGSTKLFSTMRIPLLFLAENDRHSHCAALAVAAYLRFMTGIDENGKPFVFIKDAKKDIMHKLATEAFKYPRSHIAVYKAVGEIFGEDFTQKTTLFMGHVCLSLEALKRFGACKVLASGSALHALTKNFVLTEAKRQALLTLLVGEEEDDELDEDEGDHIHGQKLTEIMG